MKQKILFFGLILLLVVYISGCSFVLPFEMAICGNGVCETDEDETCPSDCSLTETCEDLGGGECSAASYMCEGIWLQDECCKGTCGDDITEITLNEGKNHVSIPYVELNDNVADVVSTDSITSIYTYVDGTWKVWHADDTIPSDLDTLEAGRGYVFVMASAATFTLADIKANMDAVIATESGARSPHSTAVYAGWNLIGDTYGDEEDKEKPMYDLFSNIDGSYISLWMYNDAGNLEEVDISENYNIIPTRAYWIYMNADGVIVP